MALRPTKTSYFLLCLGLGMVTCLASLLEAAPPHFSSALYYPQTNFSPFPGVSPRFVISMEGGIYVPPIGQTRGRSQLADYDFSYDYKSRSITYTRRIKSGQALTPVSNDIEFFRDRYLALSLDDYAADVRRSSLTKSQQEKAGGLFNVTVPIRSRTFESLFGEGGAGLQVSGSYQISFSGRTSWTDRQKRSYNKPSMFPTLNMEQSYKFNIKGTIGSKISVEVTQDSRNDLPLANRLILRYKGADDDVLQTIEAGNTTLDLPPTRFLNYSTRVQGLFGIKTTAKLADLSITAIASQEKGSTETVNFTAGTSSRSTIVVQDVNYYRHIIFDLGRLPASIAGPDSIYGPEPYDFAPGDSIINYVLYLDNNPYNYNEQETGRLPGICYIDPTDTVKYDTGGIYRSTNVGHFERVSADKYILNPTSFYVQLRNRLDNDDILAVYMEVRRAGGAIETIGNISGDTLRLKLIKPTSYLSVNNHIWEYEWRNVYSLGSSSTDLSGLDVNIYKGNVTSSNQVNSGDLDNQDGVKYLRILGLDQVDASRARIPDGKIDKTEQIIPPGYGLLIFPLRHPFYSRYAYDSVQGNPVYLADTVPQIYNNNNESVLSQASTSKYYLAITNTQGGSSVIDLNASNIIEGSEVVSYNGTRLVEGQDYNINYDMGTLTLLNDKYTDLNSNLSVTYETAPYFSLSKKTLLGTRFEYSPGSDFKVGTTVLYKSDKSTNRKPKIGEETSRILVWDADFNYHFENNLLTRMADALPLVTANAPSYTTLSGEIAQSLPNPNVDGQAFIDDFEGSRDSYSLGLSRSGWRYASLPVVVDSLRSERAKFAWFNPPEDYSIQDIWNRDEGGANTTRVLMLRFEPVNERKTFNVDSNRYIIDTIAWDSSWNGFMRDFSSGTTSQLQNVQLLELRVRGDAGILHVDLGRISEDINGDGRYNTEDVNGNNILDEGEDVGLDGLSDNMEPGYSVSNPDPNGDDFVYSYSNVWKINGTEGNGDDPEKEGIPDIDKESQDDSWSILNAYFSYRIDLSDTTSDASFYVPGTRNDKGWKTIRIPLRDQLAIDTTVCDPDIGCPDWNNITNARIWIDGAQQSQSLTIEIAGLDLVSNVWADSLRVVNPARVDLVEFDVAVINNEVDARYTPPPGVSGYYDPSTNLTEKEQSLLLSYGNLSGRDTVYVDTNLILSADTGWAVRQLYRASNYMGYGKLEAYVHGDDNLSSSQILFFFRIGSDKDAYYEYRTVLKPGWALDNQVLMDFEEITALKAQLIEERKKGDTSTVIQDASGKYLIKIKPSGIAPSLTSVQYFSMGVINLDTLNTASGEVWIDELRLTDVRDNAGMATRMAISGNISDFITNYSFTYSNQDAYYRGVSDATRGGGSNNLGSGQTNKNYAFSGTVQLNKLFPRSMELTLPVSVNWSQSVQEPLLRSGTDIILPEDLKKNETSVSITKGISVSESIQKKTKNIIYNGLLNRLNTSFSYNTTSGHSPTTPWSFSESYRGTANYTLTMKKTPSVQLLKWASSLKAPFGLSGTRLYLYPTALDFSGTLSGTYSRSLNQSGSANPVSSTRNFSGVMNVGYKVFDNLGGTYRVTTERDLKDPQKVNIGLTDFRFGVERNYTQDFRATYAPRMFAFLTHTADYSARYTDVNNILSDSSSYHRVDLNRSSSLTLEFKHQLLIGTNKSKSVRRTAKGKPPGTFSKVGKASLTGLRYVSGVIKPVTFRIGYGEYLGLPALAGKASTAFRFGFSDDPGVRRLSSTGWYRESKTVNKSISTGSGVSFFSGLGADVKYERSVRESFSDNSTRATSITWPDLRFNLRSTRGLGKVGKIINAFSPSSGFSQTKDTERRISLPHPSSEKIRQSFSPLISFTVNITRAIRATGKVDVTKSRNTTYNESTGAASVTTKGSSSTYTFNGSYSFRNPSGVRLPLFGRLKFESILSLAVDVSYQKSQEQQAAPSNKYIFTLTSKKTTLMIKPSASYSFSSTITGRMYGRWQDSKDLYTRNNSHIREISISVEMRF